MVLGPLHRWFFLWEEIIPSLYRVVAVVVAGAVTAGLLVLVGAPWWAALPVSGVLWIGLAVVQEHDQRVERPVDEEFLQALRERAEPVLQAAGFTFHSASGGQRARRDSTDVVLYEADPTRHPDYGDGARPCVDLWIRRDHRAGVMDVSVDWQDLGDLLGSDRDLAVRVTQSIEPVADAEALARAFKLVFRSG